MFVLLTQVCVAYIIKEVASFCGVSLLMGVAHYTTPLELYSLVKLAGRKLLVALCTNWN